MKLQNKLLLQMLSLVLVTIGVVCLLLVSVFHSVFQRFLLSQQENRLEQITTSIGTMMRSEDITVSSEQLAIYANHENINITIMDSKSTIIASYQGLEKHSDSQLETRHYKLSNGKQELVGQMIIAYDSNDPDMAKLSEEFSQKVLSSMLLGVGLVSGVAALISFAMARSITDPIRNLSDATNRIREKDYELAWKASDIREIQNLSENLRYLASSLKEQEGLRKNYAQDISHELRTPLTNLSLHLEALEDGMIPMDEQAIHTLQAGVKQLQSITVRLKESFEEGNLLGDYRGSHLDFSQLMNQILDAFEPALEKKQAQLIRVISPSINLFSDSRFLSQLMNNLLSNALKAVDKEGWIRVNLQAEKTAVVFSVADSGVGIPAEKLPHIFDRFYRVDSSRNRKTGGQGLGLAISKAIVQRLSGEISVSSKEGHGTTFTVTLPTSPNPTVR